MSDTTIPPSLARIAEAARRLGPPDPADDGDELRATMQARRDGLEPGE